MPQVTVCIPAFNRSGYLRLALDSVFRQTWKDFEVLVVDDGSTDDTPEMMRTYPQPVRYLRQENRGEPAARNRLIAETRTPLIAWLDSDDLWLPNKLQEQMALLEGRPPRTVLYGSKISIDADGRAVKRHDKPAAVGRITAALFARMFIPTPSVIIPTALAQEAGGFDERYPVCSDYRLWLRLSLTCDFLACPEPLIMCRRHTANISAPSPTTQKAKLAVLEEFYFELGGQAAIPRPLAMARLSRECRKVCDLVRRAGQRQEALSFGRKALGYRATPRALLSYAAAIL